MKVLIIEDDVDFREGLAKDLKHVGQEVFCFWQLKDLDEFEQLKSITHAIVDLRVGLESGIDYVKKIRSVNQDCFIVMLTAYGSIRTTVEAMKQGADEYILKPCRFNDLYLTLQEKRNVLNKENPSMLDLYQKEKEYIDFVLEQNERNISKSAKVLGIKRQSLQRKLKKYTEKKNE
ncbi:MAG: response regulator [Bacteriovoracaceae bacterium]|jgi:two-component system response regulator RegA|nr:response regulator [Bacteriovoracaceae bacterium]|tara:strand:+ start:100 stop:627 length:528 start_codon:yes stop_codon:yes gene_type:complete